MTVPTKFHYSNIFEQTSEPVCFRLVLWVRDPKVPSAGEELGTEFSFSPARRKDH